VIERILEAKAHRRPPPRPEKGDQRMQVGLAAHPRAGVEAQPRVGPVGIALLRPRRGGDDRRRKGRLDARLPSQRHRKAHILESFHLSLSLPQPAEPGEAVAKHLRQRPGEHLRRPPPPRVLRGLGDRRPLRLVLGPQHEAREIMLLGHRIAEPRRRRRDPPPRRAMVARRRPVIILELQDIEGRRRPAGGHVGPLGLRAVEHRRQIDQQQRLRLRRHRPHRRAKPRGRRRQHRSGGIQRRLLRGVEGAADIADRRRRERRLGGIVVEADGAVAAHPPPRLADLEAHPLPRRRRQFRERLRHQPQIVHRPGMGRRQQSRGRLPAGQRRRAVRRALLPVAPAMHVEQLVGQRQDHLETHRPARARKSACHAAHGPFSTPLIKLT
jgi:hypothetical protein